MYLTWKRNATGGYESNGMRWNNEECKHEPMFLITKKVIDYKTGRCGWNLNDRKTGETRFYGKLAWAKDDADKRWNAIPRIPTDEEEGWRLATGFNG